MAVFAMTDRNWPENGERKTEDDRAKEQLGPQGVPGKPDSHPEPVAQQEEQMPKSGEFDGHTA